MKNIILYVLKNKLLKKLILSKSVDKTVLRAQGRLVEIKNKPHLAIETFYADGKAIQKNYPIEGGAEVLCGLMPEKYKQLNIITTSGDCEIKASKKGKIMISNHIKKGAVAAVVPEKHNKQKQYIIPSSTPVDFLVALGVQNESGKIIDKKMSKFRQINRFLEIVSDVEENILSGDDMYILDLCCGKSYLSFAIYYYFTVVKGKKVIMDCVDLKKDVIEYCSTVAKKLGYNGLNFTVADINEFEIKRAPDLTVSLHACDIATDIVLSKGINSGSNVILSTPCCHHQTMQQLKSSGKTMDFLLEHSILKQKFADSVTDALRCKILQISGYEVQAIELIDPEETPKNVLIKAVKKKTINFKAIDKLKQEYKEICNTLGIEPYLKKYAE